MIRLVLGLAMATLVMGRPDLYKEKEDFHYSRSSTDEGTKSGYYDAQRGNMGGNYERAHNMDGLAQHQMGGLVKQVEGELGEGSNTRTGSVYSSANSRGMFGSGHYDLSNLQGRNFQEGINYGNSQMHSSSKSAHDSQSSSNSNSRYSTSGRSGSNYQEYQINNLQDAQISSGANQFDQGTQRASNSRYSTQSGYHGSDVYSQSQVTDAAQNFDGYNQHRLISTVPVKIIVRPGQRVAIPIATQTYQNSHIASLYDQNAANSDAEVMNANGLEGNEQRTGKHYQSSYSYQKQWENHGKIAAVEPTIETGSKGSLYDNSRNDRGYQYQSKNDGYEHRRSQNAAISQTQHETAFNAQHHGTSNSNLNGYSQLGSQAEINSESANTMAMAALGTTSSNPKSYHSSYSYHKSWERQGEPYVIKPLTNGLHEGQTSGRIMDASNTQDFNSQGYGYNCIYACNPSHSRVARSYSSDQLQIEQQQSQNLEDMGQHTQTLSQWDNIENLGQQSHNNWEQNEYSSQQVQNNWNNLQDLGQQSQTAWDKTSESMQQTQNLEDFGQQSQNSFNNIEDLGQQTQTAWENKDAVGQKTQKLEDFGGQQTLNTFTNIENLGQQSQTAWDVTGSSGQETQQLENFNQQSQTSLHNIENLGQQQQNKWESQSDNQQLQNTFDDSENFGQQTQNTWDKLEDLGQRTEEQSTSQNLRQYGKDRVQQTQHKWVDLNQAEQTTQEHSIQQTENQYSETETENSIITDISNKEYNINQPQSIWTAIDTSKDQTSIQQHQILQENEPELPDVVSSLDHKKLPQISGHGSSDIWDKLENNAAYIKNESLIKTIEIQPSNVAFISNDFDNMQEKSPNENFLGGLWGKIDDLDGEYAIQNNEQSVKSKSDTEQTYNSDSILSNVNNSVSNFTNNNAKDVQNPVTKTQTFGTGGVTSAENGVHIATVHHVDKFLPKDIGRGDIGPEDSIFDTSTTESNYNIYQTSDNPQESINQPSNIDLNINRFDQHNVKYLEKSDHHTVVQQNVWQLEQQSSKHVSENFSHQNEHMEHFSHNQESNMEIQNEWNYEQQKNENLHQQNNEHLTDFHQHNEGEHIWNMGQKNTNNDFPFGLNKQNQKVENFSNQHSEQFTEQHTVEQKNTWYMEQQNTEHNYLDDENQNNKNKEKFNNSEQESDTQIQDKLNLGHENLNFDQQNIEQFADSDQQNWHIEQQNSKQDFLEHFSPQNYHNIETMPNIDQQSSQQQQNNWNLQQINQDFNQQHIKQHFTNFDQQIKTDQENIWNIEQQNSKQELFKDFSEINKQNFNDQFADPVQHQEPAYTADYNNKESEFIDILPEQVTRTRVEHSEEQKNVQTIDENIEIQQKKVYNNLMNTQEDKLHANLPISSTIAPTTDKPGFWKSVGNSFNNAKNKVSSWFGR